MFTTNELHARTVTRRVGGAVALALEALAAGIACLYFFAFATPANVEAGIACFVLTVALLRMSAYRGLMARAGLLALLLAAAPAAASAQDVMLTLDKRLVVGLGTEYTTPAELDGTAGTIELVQWRELNNSLQIRGIAFRGAGVCTGQWFDPFTAAPFGDADWFRTWSVQRVGAVDVAYVESMTTISPVRIRFGC